MQILNTAYYCQLKWINQTQMKTLEIISVVEIGNKICRNEPGFYKICQSETKTETETPLILVVFLCIGNFIWCFLMFKYSCRC